MGQQVKIFEMKEPLLLDTGVSCINFTDPVYSEISSSGNGVVVTNEPLRIDASYFSSTPEPRYLAYCMFAKPVPHPLLRGYGPHYSHITISETKRRGHSTICR